ncbi:phage head morphogenesis protein [Tepidimicrobium xylanilyticum]|uniref:Phage Mu protein F like protein n=1 Tax=Tepidimicrobium xylanilyticum TaxID=1123352 RepID=A0A1H3EIH7_9FIRM|nr:phage minor head protein [Tepidimicrobium xylanilyticum]GMG96246.1 hypothetical protein EN5CB1_10720 [Tepidimicrobium xylanilyticum]SDX78556.1 Phage Mu protein F like protein [Tepidimicrobium xylanilyticum]
MNKASQIYKSIDKTLNKLIEINAKDYLKYQKNKPWYSIALEGYIDITRGILEFLKKYAKQYWEIIEGKNIFITKTKDEDNSKKQLIDGYDGIINENIKKIIERTIDQSIDELEEFYDEIIRDFLIIEAAKAAAYDIGLKFNFNKFDVLTRNYLRDKKIKWAKQVAETTEKRVKELLVKGYEEGLGTYEIAELIYNDYLFSYERAETIARTELLSACNYADFTAWKLDDNIYGKKWSAVPDGRTRLNHALADGQVRKIDEPFTVGGELLMYPLDVSLGASARNVVNCRCTMFYLTKEEYEKEVSSFKGLIF